MQNHRPKHAQFRAKMFSTVSNMDSTLQQSELLIRAMAPQDAEAVSQLSKQLGYERSASEIRAWIERLIATPHNEQAAFVACAAGEVVGWVEVAIARHLQSPPFALIGGLVVKHGFRSRGVGRLLCAHVESWAWQRQIDIVRVTSRSTRLNAHRFYLNGGYREVKTSLVFEKTRPV